MKITHIVASTGGGAGIGAMRYHQGLLAAGVDSRVLVAGSQGEATDRVAGLIEHKPPLATRLLRRLRLPGDRSDLWRARIRAAERTGPPPAYELFSLPKGGYRPWEHPWTQEADVVNLHWIAGALDLKKFLKGWTKPLIVTLHDQHPYLGGVHYTLDLPVAPHLATLESELREVKKAAYANHRIGVVGNSDWNTREAQASRMFPENAIFETVYFPMEPIASRDRSATKEKLHLDTRRFVIGFACDGLGNRRKGFDLALEAVGRLPSSITDRCMLLTFGRDDEGTELPIPSMHLGYIHGSERKWDAYAAMDVFIAPSRAEAFGLTALEALACGTPVVAGDVGGLAEAVGYGEAGILCPPENPTALGEAVKKLFSDADLRGALAERGLALVRDRHAPQNCGAAYAELAGKLLVPEPENS